MRNTESKAALGLPSNTSPPAPFPTFPSDFPSLQVLQLGRSFDSLISASALTTQDCQLQAASTRTLHRDPVSDIKVPHLPGMLQ
jgi:hypothetical protein